MARWAERLAVSFLCSAAGQRDPALPISGKMKKCQKTFPYSPREPRVPLFIDVHLRRPSVGGVEVFA